MSRLWRFAVGTPAGDTAIFRCRVGHALSSDSLDEAQLEDLRAPFGEPLSSSGRGPDFLRRIRKRLGPHTRQQLVRRDSEREVQARTLRQFLIRVLSAADPESESS